jgi:hypothetical protein
MDQRYEKTRGIKVTGMSGNVSYETRKYSWNYHSKTSASKVAANVFVME